jgi:hypothetical protein
LCRSNAATMMRLVTERFYTFATVLDAGFMLPILSW